MRFQKHQPGLTCYWRGAVYVASLTPAQEATQRRIFLQGRRALRKGESQEIEPRSWDKSSNLMQSESSRRSRTDGRRRDAKRKMGRRTPIEATRNFQAAQGLNQTGTVMRKSCSNWVLAPRPRALLACLRERSSCNTTIPISRLRVRGTRSSRLLSIDN